MRVPCCRRRPRRPRPERHSFFHSSDHFPRSFRTQANTAFVLLGIPGVPIPRNFSNGLSLYFCLSLILLLFNSHAPALSFIFAPATGQRGKNRRGKGERFSSNRATQAAYSTAGKAHTARSSSLQCTSARCGVRFALRTDIYPSSGSLPPMRR